MRDKVPPEVFTKPYTNPVGGTPENVRANLREALRLLQGGRLRDARPASSSTPRPASRSPSSSCSTIRASSASCCSTSPRWSGSASTSRCAPSTTRNTRTALRNWDFDIIIDVWGAVAVARQRAARLLGLAGRRSARLAQLRRHQESGGRRADRARHLRQGPRRAGRRHQGARPRAAVESLRRAAMDLRQACAPRAGTVSAGPRRMPKYGAVGVPDDLVVGRGAGRQDGIALVSRHRAATR